MPLEKEKKAIFEAFQEAASHMLDSAMRSQSDQRVTSLGKELAYLSGKLQEAMQSPRQIAHLSEKVANSLNAQYFGEEPMDLHPKFEEFRNNFLKNLESKAERKDLSEREKANIMLLPRKIYNDLPLALQTGEVINFKIDRYRQGTGYSQSAPASPPTTPRGKPTPERPAGRSATF